MESVEEMLEALKGRITHISETPLYTCEICHDNGWLYSKDENGYRFVKECECQKARKAEALMRASGLADSLDSQTFDSFRDETPLQHRVKTMAERYLQDILTNNDNPRKPWLYIGGNPGSGKTHICTAICGELLKRNIGVKYMQWINESRRLKAVVNDPDFDEEVEVYTRATVLYVDDLLKQRYTENPVFSEADIRLAFSILNTRYIMNKPTIISSEWDLVGQLLPADEGVFSRVYERCKGYTIQISRRQENNYRMRAEAV